VHANGKSKRDDLAGEWFSPARLLQFSARVHVVLGSQWQRHQRRVDLDELTELDFVAVPTTDAAVVRHLSGFLNPRRPRVCIRDLERFCAATIDLICECAVVPSALPLLLNRTEPIYCFQLTDDGDVAQHLWLTSSNDGGEERCSPWMQMRSHGALCDRCSISTLSRAPSPSWPE
jgi:hypothetical protein